MLVGAGSIQFGAQLLGDFFHGIAFAGAEIVFSDINPDAAQRTRMLAQDHVDANGLDHRIIVGGNLRRALNCMDFIVIMIEVGDRFRPWDMDWRIPQPCGIRQVQGKNGGSGGLFHALRVIPPILDICGAVAEVAPEATIFNFPNPMSGICTTAHRKFPQLNFVGMRHGIASLERHLPKILGQSGSNIRCRAAGLNHFSVLARMEHVDSGDDAYPDVRRLAPAHFAELPGYSEIPAAARRSGKSVATEGRMDVDLGHISETREWSDPRLFREILERFGVFPITTDSHFGECIGWAHEICDQRGILDFHT